MNEKRMTTFFGKYMSENPPKRSEAYELKFTSGNSIPFSSLKEHQREALLKTGNGGLYHRITDQPWIKDRPFAYTLKKPFDCFFVKCGAYVVIWFYKPRKPKRFYKISIQNFLMMEKTTERKSFAEEIAEKFCSEVMHIS